MLVHTDMSHVQVIRHCHVDQESRVPVCLNHSSDLPVEHNPAYVGIMESAASQSCHHHPSSPGCRASSPPRVHREALELLKVQLPYPFRLVFSPYTVSAMSSLFLAVAAIALAISSTRPIQLVHARCRNQPGDPGYPTAADWSSLNDTIGGSLLKVVPSAEACREIGCTEAQWTSGIFRQTIPGAMNIVSTVFQIDPVYRRSICSIQCIFSTTGNR